MGVPLGWSDKFPSILARISVAVLGMTVPIAVGVVAGRPEVGVFAAFGGLAVGGEGAAPDFRRYIRSLCWATVAGWLAFLVGGFLSQQGVLRLVLLPPLFFLVSLFGGMSRTLARYTTLFLLFLVIAISVELPGVGFVVSSSLFLGGAVWTVLVAMVFWPLRKRDGEETQAPAKAYTGKQLAGHWAQSLGTLQGWLYALRLTASALVAVVLIAVIPLGHMFWILLTVGILVQRNAEHLPVKMLQRGVGTLLGVLLLGALSLIAPGVMVSVAAVLVFSGLRAYFKENHYLLYSVAMTALVVILLDFGAALSFEVMLDRLVATVIGCAVSFVVGYAVWMGVLGSKGKGMGGK